MKKSLLGDCQLKWKWSKCDTINGKTAEEKAM